MVTRSGLTWRTVGVASAVLAVQGAAGCILTTDFSGLDGVARDASDAADDRNDGALEASLPEGKAPFGCEGALLCDTFDTGRLVPPWTRSYESLDSTTRSEADPQAVSPPNVLRTSVQLTDGSGHYAYVARDLALPVAGSPSSVSSAKASFSVFVEGVGPTGRAAIAGFVFADGTSDEHTIRLLVGEAGPGATLEEVARGTLRTFALSGAPPLRRWSRMSLAVAAGHIVVTLDDKIILDVPAASTWPTTSSLRSFLGINFLQGAPQGYAFRFDDYRLDGN